MPVDPSLAEDLAAAVRALYVRAEIRLFEIVAARLRRGIDSPGWADSKLVELSIVRREIAEVVNRLSDQSRQAVAEAVTEAYRRGSDVAATDLRNILRREALAPIAERSALQALISEAVLTTQVTHTTILRQATDAYRLTVAEASGEVLIGAATRRQAAQTALSRFANLGLTGFRDRAGRNWDLATYAEMATRTATGRAAVQGHADRLADNGRDLVIVSSHPGSCPLCAEWQGRVLSLRGRTQGIPTLADARNAGLQHVNCRHSIGLYVSGLTQAPVVQPEGDRKRDYALSQQQRSNERTIRRWRRRQVAALTPVEAALARAKVAEWQGIQQRFVDNNGLRRKYEREGLGAR